MVSRLHWRGQRRAPAWAWPGTGTVVAPIGMVGPNLAPRWDRVWRDRHRDHKRYGADCPDLAVTGWVQPRPRAGNERGEEVVWWQNCVVRCVLALAGYLTRFVYICEKMHKLICEKINKC